jgi:hypothetical protein
MRKFQRGFAIGSMIVLGVLASQCSAPKPAPPPAAAATPAPVTPLIGGSEMKPVVSVKELMKYMIDPLADNIFDAVGWDITPKGLVETKPKTDADWEKVDIGAVTIAEGVYLLKVPRPFAPDGDVNNSTGPNPPELSPTQIKEKIDRDPVLWNAKIEALRNAMLEVRDIVKRKDVDALFDAGGDLDKACENCHLEYWYPGDKDDVAADAAKKSGFGKPGKVRKNGEVNATVPTPVAPGTKQ